MAVFAAGQQLWRASLDSATSVRAEGSLPAVSIATLADAPFSHNRPIHMPSHFCRGTVGDVAERPAGVGSHAVCLTAFKRREKVSQELCIFAL